MEEEQNQDDDEDIDYDDEDSCWRVRREALRLIESLVIYHNPLHDINLSLIDNRDVPPEQQIIKHLRERNENVRDQVI